MGVKLYTLPDVDEGGTKVW